MGKNRKFIIHGMLFALLILNSGCANADPLFNVIDPAIINRDNQIQLKDSFIEEEIIEPVEDETRLKDILDKQKQKEIEEDYLLDNNLIENPQFRLNNVFFSGNTKISSRKLERLASDLIGKDVYLEDILDLTIKVSRYYQKKVT